MPKVEPNPFIELENARYFVQARFPRASEDFLRLNSQLQNSKPKRALREKPLVSNKGKAKGSGRVVVRITSYRSRLIDPDNLCGKYVLDSLRYAGILRGDTAEDVVYQITQKKVSHKKQEKTLIEIWLER